MESYSQTRENGGVARILLHSSEVFGTPERKLDVALNSLLRRRTIPLLLQEATDPGRLASAAAHCLPELASGILRRETETGVATAERLSGRGRVLCHAQSTHVILRVLYGHYARRSCSF